MAKIMCRQVAKIMCRLTVPFTYIGDYSGERTADIASVIRTGY